MLLYYAGNATQITPAAIQSGRAEIEKSLAVLMTLNPRESVAKVVDAHVSGNEAWADGTWSITLSVTGNDALHQTGFWAIVYDRDGDAWKIRLEIFNITPPPPPPKQ